MKELNRYYNMTFMFNMIRFFISFYFPLYFLKIGLNGFEIGILIGILTASNILFSFHLGVKADRVSNRNLLIWGLGLASIFSFMLLFVKEFYMLVGLFFLGGIGIIMVNRALDTLVYKSVDKKKKGSEVAWYTIVKCGAVIIGLIVGAYIIDFLGYGVIYIVSAILFGLMIFYGLKIKKNDTYTFGMSHYIKDLKDRKILIFSSVIFIFSIHFGAEQTSYSPFLRDSLGLGIIPSSYFMGGVIIPLLIGSLITGKLVDKKWGKMRLLTWTMLLSGIGGALFAMTSNVWLSFIARSFHEFGDGAFFVAMNAGIVSYFNKKRVGGHSGFIQFIVNIGALLGALIFGPIGYRFGFNLPHIVGGGLAVFASVVLLIVFRKK